MARYSHSRTWGNLDAPADHFDLSGTSPPLIRSPVAADPSGAEPAPADAGWSYLIRGGGPMVLTSSIGSPSAEPPQSGRFVPMRPMSDREVAPRRGDVNSR